MWKKDLFGRRGTEICENLVTMGPTVHAYWGAAFFALKPLELSEDKKSLKLQFFWLRPLPRTGGYVPLEYSPDLKRDLKSSNEDAALFDHRTGKTICSGDTFTMTTDDPVNKPLPSVRVLQMQWVLHRLAALCGGAEALELKMDRENQEDVGSLCCIDEKSEDEFCDLGNTVSVLITTFHSWSLI